METKIPARMVRMSEKAARVHSDLIRPATQLLYLASGSECRGGCEYITGLSAARPSQLPLRLYRRRLVFGVAAFPPPRAQPPPPSPRAPVPPPPPTHHPPTPH